MYEAFERIRVRVEKEYGPGAIELHAVHMFEEYKPYSEIHNELLEFYPGRLGGRVVDWIYYRPGNGFVVAFVVLVEPEVLRNGRVR